MAGAEEQSEDTPLAVEDGVRLIDASGNGRSQMDHTGSSIPFARPIQVPAGDGGGREQLRLQRQEAEQDQEPCEGATESHELQGSGPILARQPLGGRDPAIGHVSNPS